jgi:hypothetical protein
VIRFFSEGRDCAGLMAVALCGWLVLAGFPAVGMHAHHAGGNSPLMHGGAMASVMLYPLSVEPVRHVRRSSFACARPRQILAFLLVYSAIWIAFGTAAAVASANVPPNLALTMFALALGSAWLWQSSAIKRSVAGRCHASWAVYGDGLAGLGSAAGYGARIGIACLLSCGPLMLGAMLFPWPSVGMLLAFVLIVRERFGLEVAIRENAKMLGLGTSLAIIGAGLGGLQPV